MNDIKKSLRLREPLLTFKTPCFRENIFYDVIFDDNIRDSYEHLKDFVLECLEGEDQNVPQVSILVRVSFLIVNQLLRKHNF